MTKIATITDLQRKSKQIQEWVKQGYRVIIKSGDEEVMLITLPNSIKNKKKKADWFEDWPKLDASLEELDLPENLNRRDIYEKYGAKID
jgi:hypothetical protein